MEIKFSSLKRISRKLLGTVMALFLIFGSFGTTLAYALEGFDIAEPISDLQLDGNYNSPIDLKDGGLVESGVWYAAENDTTFQLSDTRVGYYVAESYGGGWSNDPTFYFGNYCSYNCGEVTYHSYFDFLCGMYLTRYDMEYYYTGRIQNYGNGKTVFRITYTGDELPGIPGFSDYDYDSDKCLYKYSTVADKAFFIGVGIEFDETTLNIPDTIDGYPVIGISNCAIPSDVTTVNIPETVTEISSTAFADATALKTITVDGNNKKFESRDGVLYTKGLSELVEVPLEYSGTLYLPATFGDSDFEKFDFSNITSFDIDSSNKNLILEDGVFYNRDKTRIIKAVGSVNKNYVMPETVTAISDNAFSENTVVESVSVSSSVTEISYAAFANCTSLKSVSLPEGIKTIADTAFGKCTSLESIVIPDSVTHIDDWAFNGNAALSTVTIGKGVKNIDLNAFFDCENLKSVYIKDLTNWFGITFESLYSNPLWYAKSFYLNNKLVENITVPTSVKKINSYAFAGCESLKTLKVTDNVASIGCEAFYNCSSLNTATFGSGLKTIESMAFYAGGLKSIVLPKNVETVEQYAFAYCRNLKSADIQSSNINMEEGTFFGCESLSTLDFADGVKTVPDYCFVNSAVASSKLPNTVTEIGYKAFYGSKNLKEIDLPNNLTHLSATTYANTAWFKAQPNGVIYLEHFAYGHKGDLTGKLTIKNGTKAIASYAFEETSISDVVIPYSVQYINDYAFYGCTNLNSVTIPASVKEIGECSFATYADDFTIKGISGSTAEKYANNYGYKFVALKKPDTVSLSAVSNTSSGVKVTWSKVSDAVSYAVYRKSGDGSYKAIKTGITGTSFTDTTANSGTKYTYTVRALNNVAYGSYDTTGKSITYIAMPKPSVSNANGGVTVKWSKVTGAKGYYVYRKTGNGSWSRIANVTTTSYTDKSAKSGTTYKYTVKAYNGKTVSAYNTSGVSIKYLAMPKLSGVTNVSGGVTVKWSKVTGAKGYYVYRKSGNSGWKKIADVTGASYTDKSAKSGTTYTYTVKAYSGKTASAHNTTGLSIKYLAMPKLTGVSSAKAGVTVKWSKVTGASGYYVYRKTGNGSWSKIATVSGNSKVSYLDKTAKKGTTYTYTVKAYSGKTASAHNTTGLKIKR